MGLWEWLKKCKNEREKEKEGGGSDGLDSSTETGGIGTLRLVTRGRGCSEKWGRLSSSISPSLSSRWSDPWGLSGWASAGFTGEWFLFLGLLSVGL